MAVVHCHNTNGVVLRLYEEVAGPLGIKEHRPKGDAVTLRSGRNEVDDAFWNAWFETNKAAPDKPGSGLLAAGILHVDKPEPKAEAEPPKP